MEHLRRRRGQDRGAGRIIDAMEARLRSEFLRTGVRLDAIRNDPAVDVFGLDERMLARSISLALELQLQPYDQAVLGAVLTRADALHRDGAGDVAFCERDSDLQPWDRRGISKPALQSVYDDARIWVYEDFDLATPRPPPDWFQGP